MFHDDSVGDKKLALVVVKISILEDGVRLRRVDHSLCSPKSARLCPPADQGRVVQSPIKLTQD